MKKQLLLSMVSLGMVTCAHERSGTRHQVRQVWPSDRASLAKLVSYQAELEEMSSKDLRQEVERLRKAANEARSEEVDTRLSLAQAALHREAKAYQKAAESLQSQVSRAGLDADLKNWLKQYSQNLNLMAQLDKELTEEKKQRQEAEKKMKALSDIELEMRQRENGDGSR